MEDVIKIVGLGAVAIGGVSTASYKLWQWYKLPGREKQMPTNVNGKTVEQLRDEAHRKLGINTVHDYNIAFCGASGAGKSSLNNALRGIEDDHQLAAVVKAGVECDEPIAKYVHPDPKVRQLYFWDIPGAGTVTNPTENYFIEKCLYAFDFLFIVGTSRFTELEFNLMKYTIQYNVPVAFVRNKIDQDIYNEMRRFKLGPDNVEAIELLKNGLKCDIHRSLEDNLNKANISERAPLFIVSSHSIVNENDARLYGMDEVQLVDHMWNVVKGNRFGR